MDKREQELRNEIAELRKQLDAYRIEVTDEHEEQWCDMVDSEYPNGVVIWGFTFTASTIIRQHDEPGYWQAVSDWVDSLRVQDDPGYQELEEELAELEYELDDLLEELEEDE